MLAPNKSVHRICLWLLLAVSVSGAGIAFAAGPVAAGAVPGTVNVQDSDSGNGQAWGRGTGRSMTFTVNDASQLSTLVWGVVGGSNPSLAFDGNASGSGEVMTLFSGASDFAIGRAVWTGSANLQLYNGSVHAVPTRFTLTMRNAANAPVLLSGTGGPSVGGSLLGTTVTANVLFEMQYLPSLGGDSSYRPVLELYDTLQTPPGQPPSTNVGPVMTGVNLGFYFTGGGLSLEEHDAHITAELGPLKTKIGFLYEDWPLRWNGLSSDLGVIKSAVQNAIPSSLSGIQQQLSQLLGQSGGTGNLATKQNIDELRKTLMILWGLEACPLTPAQCAGVKFIQNLSSQSSVDTVRVNTEQILIGLNNANVKIDGLATHAQVDGILIGLNNATNGLATQSSVNALDGKVNALQVSLDAAQAKIDELQDSLDNTASQALDVRAIQIEAKVSKQLRWLVKTTRDGVMVDAILTRFATIRTPGAAVLGNVMAHAKVAPLATGLHDVTLELVKDVTDGVAYLFEASMSAGGATIKGSALMVTEKKGASPF